LPPEEKAEPAPVRISTLMLSVMLHHWATLTISSARVVPVRALRTSSRFRVRVATAPSMVSRESFSSGCVMLFSGQFEFQLRHVSFRQVLLRNGPEALNDACRS
jgi:hypothetical protein